ncbi:MAG: T9SS type A sorting domain-containing protein [candidate division WOR-3 bacterium]|nr:T9SS type A sorting domain-containing protein [candidate division WOR-3 bacterium]
MQKLLFVLMLGLLVSIGFASDGTVWIGKTRPEALSCPNPTPVVTELPQGDFNPDSDTLAYDDRLAFSAWIYYREDNGWGVKFVPPTSSGTVSGALVYLWGASWPIPGGNQFKVKVVDSDGPAGTPGTTLFDTTVTGTRGQWNFVPFSVSFTNPSFYIFYVQVDSFPNCPGLGIDRFDNAPDHVEWQYAGGNYSEETDRMGEWMIRAVIDWTPDNNNMGTTIFGNMVFDTLPNINLQMRGTFRNYGSQTAAPGVPVKMQITGPQGYTYTDFDQATTVTLQRGQTQMITFIPNWHVPDTMGIYTIKIWSELSGEEYPANDTITRNLSIGRWISYADWQATYGWVTWQGPERATKFNPADFNIGYPLQVTRIKAQFYVHPNYPWTDSVFRYKIYGDDGVALLYQSDTIRAPGSSVVQHEVDSAVVISSGEFYIAIAPRIGSFPSNFGDTMPDGHSFTGIPGSWAAWTNGELLIATAVTPRPGIAENRISISRPKLSVYNYPNPTKGFARLEWEIPQSGNISITMYDVTGREVKTLFDNYSETRGVLYLGINELSTGAYIIRLQTEKERATTKLLIQK